MVFIKQNVFAATVADRFLLFVGSKQIEILKCFMKYASLSTLLAENTITLTVWHTENGLHVKQLTIQIDDNIP